ncbi:MAG: hypothetical protein ACJAVI_000882 [Candidatus Azotimanducaceae bacterium]
MNIGSIHHKISNTGTASSRAAGQVAHNRGPADKVTSPKSTDSLPASFQSSAEQGSEQQLQPVDRIPATRSKLDSQHQSVEYPVHVQAADQPSQRQQASHQASENERAIAFYVITETISSVASEGELIGVDIYA